MKHPTALYTLLLLAACRHSQHSADAFAPSNIGASTRTGTRNTASRRAFHSSLSVRRNSLLDSFQDLSNMNKFELPVLLGSALAVPLGLTSLTLGSSFASAAESLGSLNLEAEILTDLVDLTSDLTVFAAPGVLVLRLGALMGRLCSFAAEYVPDHAILPEELVFQLVMLTVAWIGLVKAALPSACAALHSNVTLKDGKAYRSLFQPAGLSWLQFKALSVFALDWVTVEKGDIIMAEEQQDTKDEYVYWLYSGTARVESNGTTLYQVEGAATSRCEAGRGLLGERRLLSSLDKANSAKTKTANNNTPLRPRITVQAESPCVVLRMHTPTLQMLMDNDHSLAHSIRTMLFHGMEVKLIHAQSLQQQQQQQQEQQQVTRGKCLKTPQDCIFCSKCHKGELACF